jgi:hypothetical protein
MQARSIATWATLLGLNIVDVRIQSIKITSWMREYEM